MLYEVITELPIQSRFIDPIGKGIPSRHQTSGGRRKSIPARYPGGTFRVYAQDGYLLQLRFRLCIQQPPVEPRITSYNVCYTKLLRPQQGNRNIANDKWNGQPKYLPVHALHLDCESREMHGMLKTGSAEKTDRIIACVRFLSTDLLLFTIHNTK